MKSFAIVLLFGCLTAPVFGSDNLLAVKVNGGSAEIKVRVPNLSKLGKFESDAVVVRDIDFHFIAERNGAVLSVYLRAPSAIGRNIPRAIKTANTYDVDATFELLSFDPNVAAVKRDRDFQSYSPYFKWGAAKKGCRDFITWKDLMDEDMQFVRDDSAVFDITFTVSEPISILDRPNPTLP